MRIRSQLPDEHESSADGGARVSRILLARSIVIHHLAGGRVPDLNPEGIFTPGRSVVDGIQQEGIAPLSVDRSSAFELQFAIEDNQPFASGADEA